MLSEYWNFIDRELLEDGATRGVDAVPHFFYKIVLWSIAFSLLHILVPLLVKTLFPAWVQRLDPADRKDYASYMVCLLHHVYLVPIAWARIYDDWQLTDSQAVMFDYGVINAVVAPVCLGYLIGDTLCFALPEAINLRFEYLVHHVLILWLVLTAAFGPGPLCRFIPHLLICDTTNILFNSAWLMRRLGMRDSFFVLILEILFAVAFFFTRVVNLPLVFLSVSMKPFGAALGWARYSFAPISLLQWYWFYRIVAVVFKRLRKVGLSTRAESNAQLHAKASITDPLDNRAASNGNGNGNGDARRHRKKQV